MNPIYVKHNNKLIQGTIFKTNKKKYLSTQRKYSECDYQVWVKGSVFPCSDRTEKPVKIGEWQGTRTGISIHSIILLVNRVVTNNAQQWTYVLVFKHLHITYTILVLKSKLFHMCLNLGHWAKLYFEISYNFLIFIIYLSRIV